MLEKDLIFLELANSFGQFFAFKYLGVRLGFMHPSPSILQRIARGDASAVDDCLNQYGGLVWSIVHRHLSEACEAEDVAQEIFIDLWKNASRFDISVNKESTFVAMIARRRVIDRFRRQRARLAVESLDVSGPEVAVDAAADSLSWGEDLSRATTCLKGLDQIRRKILVLNLRDGVPLGQIAERLSIPLGTVKSHARRGLIQVRRCLGLEPKMRGVPSAEPGGVLR